MRRTILCMVSALLLAPAWQAARAQAPAQTASEGHRPLFSRRRRRTDPSRPSPLTSPRRTSISC